MRAAGIDTVFLAAPTSTDHRLKLVAEYSSGFVYLVSRTGITGEQQSLSDTALPLIERMRALTDLPLAMGFGISTADQVAAIAGHADAVVIGSAIVRQIGKDPARVESLMRDLTGPLNRNRNHAAIK
jgi:tryptophan synthase alpha chain